MTNIQPYETPDQLEAQINAQMRRAEIMAQSNMLPDKFKGNPANVLVAQEIAASMGETPWVTMSELYFVGNVPTFSAKYMRSRVRAAGHILREHYDPESMTATCTIIRKDDPDYEHTATWNMAKAKAHGLGDKGHWKKNPELMLKNRAVSENVRAACNEVMGGVEYTPEEAQEMQPVRMEARRVDAPKNGAAGLQAALGKKQPEPEPEAPSPIEQVQTAPTVEALGELMGMLQNTVDETTWEQLVEVADARAAELNA